MNSNLTQLDRLLYGWLAETDDRRFDLAFRRYYIAASAQLVSYLARRSSLPDLDCEQIAVDALLKFFHRVGRDRRQAADAVGQALPRIQPLDLGVFHARQVERWTSDVGTFRRASMSFIVPAADAEQPWKSAIQTLTDGIAPLQRQGCRLLESARAAAKDIAAGFEAGPVIEPDAPADGSDTSSDYLVLRSFALGLSNAARTGALEPGTTDSRLPRLMSFVEGSWSVVDALPMLRVPTNGYLFDMAQSLYLDECKSRGRRKRGGSGYSAGHSNGEEGPEKSVDSPHPLMTDYAEDGDGADDDRARAWHVSADEIGIDPTGDQMDEEFCEQFYAYLRKPLEDAEEAYRQASMRGRADSERKRLNSVSKKNERLMSVLSMRIEGQTQEAIADTLEISRNQVKYMVELVQASYEKFCAAASWIRIA